MYLGMSSAWGKNPGTGCCEAMVIKVKFPGCELKDLDLDVTRDKLVAQSEEYRLSIGLPHPVRDKDGTAKWDKAKDMLIVELPIIRDEA